MRPTRTLPLALLAALAALVSGCAEELVDTGSESIVGESADTALAYGDPLADGATEGPDSIVHPARGRIELTISATGSLQPGTDVELTVAGVAREAVDGGEVVLTLPTRALMDHVGTGSPELPAVASWELPSMAKGDTWSGSHTVAGEEAGWYRVMANAYTDGPDGGPWLFDDVLDEAWMVVDGTGGRLARVLDDSVPPVAGPAAGWPGRPSECLTPCWHPDTVYLHVVYSISEREGFKPAVESQVWARWKRASGGKGYRARYIVPEDGIVALDCRKAKNRSFWGDVEAPETDLVQGRDDIARWETNASHCGTLVEVEVLAHRYYPWHLLNLAADTLQKHFGHTRGRINWKLRFDKGPSYYKWAPFYEKITLNWIVSPSPSFFWTVAHEYGHALHSKALGGMWGTDKCGEEDRVSMFSATSYTCAFSEGFADYAGVVGSGGYLETCFEYLGTPKGCSASHDRKPEIEAWVAALFMDLIDDNDNYEGLDDDAEDDLTHYSGYYVAGVFRSCEAKRGSWPDRWKDRSRVYDFVWCLEEYVHKPTHKRVFPDEPVPDTAKHKRPPEQPDNWFWGDIRSTWLRNLAKEGR